MVGILRTYCNHVLVTSHLKRMRDAAQGPAPSQRVEPPNKQRGRLADDDIEQIVNYWLRVRNLRAVARKYGAHRTTVQKYVAAAGFDTYEGHCTSRSC
jgi:hypothetical protein